MQYKKGQEEERNLKALGGTADTRTSTLGSSPGTRAVKAVSLQPVFSENSPEQLTRKSEETDLVQSLDEGGAEDLFNSTFRLTPDRVWKPKKSEPSRSCESPFLAANLIHRQSSVTRKRRPLVLEQDPPPQPPERKMPVVRSRRIIRTARNAPPAARASVFLGEKCDLLLPPRFKK